MKIAKNAPHFLQAAQREIEALSAIGCAEHFVALLEHFVFENHLVLILELMDGSLLDMLEYSQCQGLSFDYVRKWGFQLARALQCLQAKGFVHGDLKPENVLIKGTDVRLCDFGSSFRLSAPAAERTSATTRYYRAPESCLAPGESADLADIDAWSLGCVLAEMYLGTPIFASAHDAEHRATIESVLHGKVPGDLQSKRLCGLDDLRNYLALSSFRIKCSLQELQTDFESFLSLLETLLTIDPSARRWKVLEAALLDHPFFKGQATR